MTQEIPIRICHDCQTPMKDPGARVKGELYCGDCAPAAVKRAYGRGG